VAPLEHHRGQHQRRDGRDAGEDLEEEQRLVTGELGERSVARERPEDRHDVHDGDADRGAAPVEAEGGQMKTGMGRNDSG